MTNEETGRRRPRWWELPALVMVAVVLALVVKSVFLQAFYIPSASMEPGLAVDDRILVQKVSYWGAGTPQRGDVVVFKDPGSWLSADSKQPPSNPFARALAAVGLYPSGGHLVKRVIGVAGDTIECCEDQGRLLVNGVPLDEADYIAPQQRCNGPMVGDCDWSAGPVPDGSLFVMGDNRSRSADSTVQLCLDRTECVSGREFVPTENVVGKVFAVIWPWSHRARLRGPETFDTLP